MDLEGVLHLPFIHTIKYVDQQNAAYAQTVVTLLTVTVFIYVLNKGTCTDSFFVSSVLQNYVPYFILHASWS